MAKFPARIRLRSRGDCAISRRRSCTGSPERHVFNVPQALPRVLAYCFLPLVAAPLNRLNSPSSSPQGAGRKPGGRAETLPHLFHFKLQGLVL